MYRLNRKCCYSVEQSNISRRRQQRANARAQIGKRAVSSSPSGLAPPGGPVATTLCPETTVSSSPPGLALDRQVEGNTAPPVALKAAENPLFDVSRR